MRHFVERERKSGILELFAAMNLYEICSKSWYCSTGHDSPSISNSTGATISRITDFGINYLFSLVTPRFSFVSFLRQKRKTFLFLSFLKTQTEIFQFHGASLFHFSERDDFVKVNWENIKRQAWPNFKQFHAHVSMFSTPYDYDSIMHYSPQAFAINRSIPSMVPLRPAKNMGQREGKLLFV